MLLRFLVFILIGLSLGLPAQGSLALRGKALNEKCKSQDSKSELIVIEKVEGRGEIFSKENIEAMIPTNMQATNNGNEVFSKIMAKAGQSLMKSDFIKNSALFKTAKKVEKSTKVEVASKKTKKQKHSREPAETQHKVNFDIQALKTKARIKYQGFLNSKLEYTASHDLLVFSIEEPLSEQSKIAISHTQDPQQSRQLLQYQLSW